MDITDTSSYRVASRFLWGTIIADPKEELHKFQALIDILCDTEELAKSDLEKAKKLIEAINRKDSETGQRLSYELGLTSGKRFTIKLSQSRYNKTKGVAQTLFWAILQQYQLPPQLQRSIEAASRFWSKTKLPKTRYKSVSGTYNEVVEELEDYLKLCSELHKQVANAQAAIAKGKLHADPEIAAKTKIKVGSFTLINTGSFTDEIMAKAADVVEKAEKAMRGIGQGRVCYGDILISKTISNKRTIAAFYVTNSDEMFIRANVPSNWDVVRTICHELSHRLYHKFLQSKHSEINDIYYKLKFQQHGSELPEEYLPERGEELVSEGKKLKLTEVSRYKQRVTFVKEGDPPNVAYTAPLLIWLKMKGIEPHQIPDYKGFVTKYAGTSSDENFCEMVSFLAIGKLPQSQIGLLEPILS